MINSLHTKKSGENIKDQCCGPYRNPPYTPLNPQKEISFGERFQDEKRVGGELKLNGRICTPAENPAINIHIHIYYEERKSKAADN